MLLVSDRTTTPAVSQFVALGLCGALAGLSVASCSTEDSDSGIADASMKRDGTVVDATATTGMHDAQAITLRSLPSRSGAEWPLHGQTP
jgi:hypothetical protein